MNKTASLADVLATLKSGQSIAFGGGGTERKPMAAAKAVGAGSAGDLHLIAFLGGPEVDLLVGLGKVKKISFAYVGFDAFGLAPNFRVAREAAAIEATEYSESMILAAIEAGAKQLPFLPSRAALGTDLLSVPGTPLTTFACPLTGQELIAVPALEPDVAILHVNEADAAGNGRIYGDDYGDVLLARAAKRVILTAERLVESVTVASGSGPGTTISRLEVDAVCVAPGGAAFTSLYPDYRVDLAAVVEYQKNATDRDWLEHFVHGEVAVA